MLGSTENEAVSHGLMIVTVYEMGDAAGDMQVELSVVDVVT